MQIINFQEEIDKETDKILYIRLEEPDKLSIFFSKRIKRVLNKN